MEKNLFDQKLAQDGSNGNNHLHNLCSEPLIIEALDGQACLADVKKVFTSGFDPDFKNWNLQLNSAPTPVVQVGLSEMMQDATFEQVFRSISDNLDNLSLTFCQIKRFCEKYPDWLRRNGHPTLFLLQGYFVILVNKFDNGLYSSVFELRNGNVWKGEFRYRLVYRMV